MLGVLWNADAAILFITAHWATIFILWRKITRMADAKMRALVGIGRFLVAVAAGAAVWWMWTENRPFDEWYVPIGAGAVVVIFAFLLLSKLKGGGD